MFKNYLKVALRSVRRYSGYAFINVFGLALGITACLLIFLYVQDETTHDHFHTHAEETYLLRTKRAFGSGGGFVYSNPSVPLTNELLASAPDVRQVVRVLSSDRLVVRQGAARHYEEKLYYTEPSFFEVFDFDLQVGEEASALARPNTIVLTPRAAAKYFGTASPLGQTLTVQGDPDREFEVTGVLAKKPSNTHFDFELLASAATLEPAFSEGSPLHTGKTYLLMREGGDIASVGTQMTALLQAGQGEGEKREPLLEPLKSLHLDSSSSARQAGLSGNRQYIYIFGSIALLVLLVGCINFMNLTTAQALRRAKEVGVRKTVGARRMQLVMQHVGETLLYSFFAMVLATAFAELILPFFNTLVGKQLNIAYFGTNGIGLWLLLLWGVVGVLAGTYPAFVLSGFQPLVVLKGAGGAIKLGGKRFRQALVVFQFTISIALVAGLLVVQRQVEYMQAEALAMQPDQVLLLGAYEEAGTNFDAFKQALRNVSGIASVSLASLPDVIGFPATPEGAAKETFVNTLIVDQDFLSTMKLDLVEGRNFDPNLPTDADGTVLLNASAAASFGWETALGRQVERFQLLGGGKVASEVIGVVEDFPVRSLKYETRALMLLLAEDTRAFGSNLQKVLVRVQAGEAPAVLERLAALWPEYVPSHPFTYQFLDEEFAAFYQTERQLAQLFAAFGGLALLIGCMGLFGLAVYMAERRTKEVGIRKVLGASVSTLMLLLTREFMVLVGIAFVLAVPLVYFTMGRWLQDFAHRIEMGAAVFLIAGGAIFAIAILTVAYQAFRAANADPVRSLRYE